jgi:hypothetical protein
LHLVNAIGQAVEVLGRVNVGFSWKGPSATLFARTWCYVVKDLQVGMLLCAAVTSKLRLRESPALLASLLFTPRTKKTKIDDKAKSQQIADINKAKEQCDAAQRKADRAKLDDKTPQRPQKHETKPSGDSLLGGSDTSSGSPLSSSTGFDRSATTSPTNQSSRTASSFDSQRRHGSLTHRRSKAVSSLTLYNK